MAAVITVRVWTGTSAGTESAAVTGIDHASADNATNSLANRQANPLTVGTRAYEKWVALHIDAAPANNVSNFQIWGSGTGEVSSDLYVAGEQVTGQTPTSGASAVAVADFYDYTAGSKLQWDAGTYTMTDATTQFAVFQLAIAASRGPGARAQDVYNYSYDET